MTTDGMEGLLIETHNFGKTVAFWKALGYEISFATDHNSGQLRHPSGGPYLFVAERPEGTSLRFQPILSVRDSNQFTPPASGTVVRPFQPQHWGVLQLLLADPDGRQLNVHAPLPPDAQKKAARA